MKILVTGAAGFVGSALVRHILNPEFELTDARIQPTVVAVDSLQRRGDWSALGSQIASPRLFLAVADIRDLEAMDRYLEGIDLVVHCAAETSVDSSFYKESLFHDVNVHGTRIVAQAAAAANVATFLHISTDEVYGSCAQGVFAESAPHLPTNPYALSKSRAEGVLAELPDAEHMRTIIVRPSNNYGPWQVADNLIPKFITWISSGRKPPVYGTGENRRCWVHVDDTVAALSALMQVPEASGSYNIGGEEFANLDVIQMILDSMEMRWDDVEFAADRPVHDSRYCNDETRLVKLGYCRRHNLRDSIDSLVEFYRRQSGMS